MQGYSLMFFAPPNTFTRVLVLGHDSSSSRVMIERKVSMMIGVSKPIDFFIAAQ